MRDYALAAALALSACHSAQDSPAAVSADQDRQLNEAAAAIDENDAMANVQGDAP